MGQAASLNTDWKLPDTPRAERPQQIVVLGAGLAGLCSAYLLMKAGHDVTVIEASPLVGGRVRTLRAPFADGQYAEAGASFISGSHRDVVGFAREFALDLFRIPDDAMQSVLFLRGQRVFRPTGNAARFPLALSSHERQLGLGGLTKQFIMDDLSSIQDPRAPDWPRADDPTLEQIDATSFREHLATHEDLSSDAIDLLRLNYFDMMGDGIDSVSALCVLRDLRAQADLLAPPATDDNTHARMVWHRHVASRAPASEAIEAVYVVKGGNDRLPGAFAAALEKNGARVIRETPARGIEAIDRGRLACVTPAGTFEADHVISTIPPSLFAELELRVPGLDNAQALLGTVRQTPVVRVYVQTKTRFWHDLGLPISSYTDLPVRMIFDQSSVQSGRKGLLEAYASGAEAIRLAGMTEAARTEVALSNIEQVYPGVREQFTGVSASIAWREEPYQRGAYCWFAPGEMCTAFAEINRQLPDVGAKTRVHFAGDYTSAMPGWMQGALESGIAAAKRVGALAVTPPAT